MVHFQTDESLKKGPTISPELQTIITASVKQLMDAKTKELMAQVNRAARRQEAEEEEGEEDDADEGFQTPTEQKKKERQRQRREHRA